MSDERLARRAAAGDKAAFEAIFRRYHQDLYRYCLATVGNPQDAQDALQSTMVKALQALPGEEREIKLKPWLYRVAHNEAVETLRKRRPGVELDPEQKAVSWEIAEATAMRERLRQLLADLGELPERQRSALVMRELGGLDFAEIGAAFGASPAAVRQTLYEARLSLRQMDEGRSMRCEAVTRALSDADGRMTRRRDVRAHLRGCASCRAFRDGIDQRRDELTAIAPLPAAVSAGLISAAMGTKGSGVAAGAAQAAGAASAASGAGGGLAGTVGAGVGKTIAMATIVKSAATVAVVAAVGISADRGGLVDLPTGGGDGKGAQSRPETGPTAGEDEAQRKPAVDPSASATQTSSGKAGKHLAPAASGIAKGNGKANGEDEQTSSPSSAPATGKAQGKSPNGKPEKEPARGRSQEAGREDASDGPPSTANRGQQNAAAHKAPQGNSAPGAGKGKGKGGENANSAGPRADKPPRKESAAPTTPPSSESTPATPESGKGNSGSKGGGKAESTDP